MNADAMLAREYATAHRLGFYETYLQVIDEQIDYHITEP